jgi:molecular chaperone GrpE
VTDDNERSDGIQDDTYVIEDEGQSVEQIEHEMELAAEQAASKDAAAAASAASEGAPAVMNDAALVEENRTLKDRVLRTLADYENYRKRSDREKQDYFKYALSDMIRDLLPILDNFDRALDHAEEGDDFHKGVLLIYKQLNDILKRHGVTTIDEANVRFDPNIHEAVIREENNTVPSQTVVAVLQKGYFIHDRVLRPAMVKVAVGGPEETVGS